MALVQKNLRMARFTKAIFYLGTLMVRGLCIMSKDRYFTRVNSRMGFRLSKRRLSLRVNLNTAKQKTSLWITDLCSRRTAGVNF